MRKFKVKVQGVTPYMQHRMDDVSLQEWEKKRGSIIERDGLDLDLRIVQPFNFPIFIQSMGGMACILMME